MFAFVSAFPKSLHCTDETQQAETVLSAVLSIYIYIYIFDKERRNRTRTGERKNDHRNPAGNQTRDLSLSGRSLYQLSSWARSDSDQVTEPLSPSPAERIKER